MSHPAASAPPASPGPTLRQRKKAAEEDAPPPSRPFTQEQVEGIAKIKKHKAKGDLYAILGLKKGASDADIKKGYRKVRIGHRRHASKHFLKTCT